MPTNSHDKATTSGDTKPRQATTSDDRATTGRDSDAALSQPHLLTVEEAAQMLGVSPRTIQRRCRSGKLGAKQAPGEFGEVWKIDRAAAEKMAVKQLRQATTEGDDRATTSDDKEPRQATTTGGNVAAIDATTDEGERARDETAPDFRARYIAQIEAENIFLKSQLEDANRNAAELRAALRKALEIAPRQLAAAPDAATTTGDAAPETPPERAPITDATDAATHTTNAVKSPATRAPRPLWKIMLGIR